MKMRSTVNGSAGAVILITGSSGLLGSLVAATALHETDATLVLPVRPPHTRETLVDQIAAEVRAEGRRLSNADVARLVVLPLPPVERMGELLPTLRDLGIAEIIHCAGCLSYFDVGRLRAGNIELTRAMLQLGRDLDVRRFVFVSTAYSSGFVDGSIPESLHDGPREDPTDYTSTKREAEWLVAGSGLPFLIVRPSIVIGDSRDGRYRGKPYGIYQLWRAGERYFRDGLPPVLHVVASDQPVNFLHQDAFTAGFWASYRHLSDAGIVHLASRQQELPTMRDLWRIWTSKHGGAEEIHFYDRLEDVPLERVDRRLRLWLDVTSVNHEIASARWNFRLDTLEQLRRTGVHITDTTLATMRVVHDRFVDNSEALKRSVSRNGRASRPATRFVTHGARS